MSTVTKQLAYRVEQSEIDHFFSLASFLQSLQNNVFGVEIRRFVKPIAFLNEDCSLGPLFNRVLGIGEDDLAYLSEIVGFYREHGLGCRIDVSPYQGTPKVYKALAGKGLLPYRYHSFLYATPKDLSEAAKNTPCDGSEPIVVSKVTEERAAAWAAVWLNGFVEVLAASPVVGEPLAAAAALLLGQKGWSLYLATIGNQPAAAAALYVQDGAASLLHAGTLPQYRRQGCQSALLQARIADALSQGCDLFVGQSALGSTSQHNMERAGMRAAYTRAFWWSF